MIRGLSGLIDLVVVFCAREADELDDIVIEPGSIDRVPDRAAVGRAAAAGVIDGR